MTPSLITSLCNIGMKPGISAATQLITTRQTIAELEEQASEHQEATRSGAWRALAGFGQLLMFDCEGLAQALGFDQMCDLLGVNPVHRHRASADGDTSLRGVAYLSQLEDSADRKSDEWGAGGPLYQACRAAMIRFMRECTEDQLPDPFAPGAPFGPKLPPALSIVGK